MCALAACGGGTDGAAAEAPRAAAERPSATTTSAPPDDRRLVAYGLPGQADLGAGWVELNREPGGPDDPTLPTAPELGADFGGRRAVEETGAAFALFERRRMANLDEQLIAYTLLFATEDDAAAQAALYRSDTFESGCVVADLDPAVAALGAVVGVEDRPLPALADGVEAKGRLVRATVEAGGASREGRVETTVLRSGRAVGLVVRYVTIGAPEPYPVDRFVGALAAGLVRLAH